MNIQYIEEEEFAKLYPTLFNGDYQKMNVEERIQVRSIPLSSVPIHTDRSEMLSAFHWRSTPQGWHYWNSVHKRIRNL